jgi:hypothetical protein
MFTCVALGSGHIFTYINLNNLAAFRVWLQRMKYDIYEGPPYRSGAPFSLSEPMVAERTLKWPPYGEQSQNAT